VIPSSFFFSFLLFSFHLYSIITPKKEPLPKRQHSSKSTMILLFVFPLQLCTHRLWFCLLKMKEPKSTHNRRREKKRSKSSHANVRGQKKRALRKSHRDLRKKKKRTRGTEAYSTLCDLCGSKDLSSPSLFGHRQQARTRNKRNRLRPSVCYPTKYLIRRSQSPNNCVLHFASKEQRTKGLSPSFFRPFICLSERDREIERQR